MFYIMLSVLKPPALFMSFILYEWSNVILFSFVIFFCLLHFATVFGSRSVTASPVSVDLLVNIQFNISCSFKQPQQFWGHLFLYGTLNKTNRPLFYMEWNVWLFSFIKKNLPQFLFEIWKQLYPFIKLRSMLLHLWEIFLFQKHKRNPCDHTSNSLQIC